MSNLLPRVTTSKITYLLMILKRIPIKARKGGGGESNRENLMLYREVEILTIFLFVCRFGINGVKWKTRLSRNGKISDSQCIHFFLALAFGITLKK